ncbi:hypothetical protein PPACK8108_LOCUS21565 [Phakopsora pachyrhizi]|uniref:Uncharacterized protein n=1 Tax=Phakopsora pachyrhizi TaxID=170000 RepID=A0AAV0BJU4_PHAPC|nr:hypothetical protein PPACK8108_LOCUS21565 [Phakopsora pachyrhizi]
MTPLENNAHLSGAPFPHPTVSFLHPRSSPPKFLNTNTGFFTTNFSILLHLVSVNQQLANPNLKNYQGTLTKSETNPININMEASSQDAIFDGEIEFITKEAFLKNITVANRHLCHVIDNPSFPSYIRGKVKEAIDLLHADKEKVISGQPLPLDSNIKIGNAALLPAPETSSGLESNIITVNNPGIANSTQTPQSMTGVQIPSQVETSIFLTCSNISHQPTNSNASGDPNNIHSTLMVGPPDSNCTPFNSDLAINPAVANSANTLIPKVPLPVPVSCLDIFLAKTNEPFFSEDILSTTMLLDFSTPVGHLPKNIHDIVYVMQPICNPPIAQQMIWENLLFESLHMVARDIIAPKNPLSVEYTLAGFLASCFSFNKNRGAILPMEGCKANDNTIKHPASGTFKNLDAFVDKIVHVLIAINMVQAHAKCQDNPAGPSSSIHPKCKGKSSSSSIETVSSKTLQLVYKEIGLEWPLYCLLMAFCASGVRGLMLGSNILRKCGALESLQIITLSNEILKLKGNDFEEPYWPRTSKYILQILKYEIAKCIVLDFCDTWHSKVNDSRKQHLSLPKKALVNAVISELS